MQSRYVLMLENDPDDRYFTTSTIKELNLDVNMRYESFKGELPEADSSKPSLILLACRTMPEESIATIRLFKNNSSWSHIPLIILTEQLAEEHIHAYYKAGANTIITKPYTQVLTRNKIQTFFEYWFYVAELGQPERQLIKT